MTKNTVPVAEKQEVIDIKPPDERKIYVEVTGISELIVHNWSEKSKKQIRDKHLGKAEAKKEKRDPQKEYEDSMYIMADGRPGFPAKAFKAAMVDACRMMEKLPMTVVRLIAHVDGDLLPIEGTPYMREDWARNETGVVDLRYRAAFPEWRIVLPVTYLANMISAEQVVNLINFSGYVGVGEQRPGTQKNKSGTNGRFRVTKVWN